MILNIIVKHTGESAIVSIIIFPIVFTQLGLKFPYEREDFQVEIDIFKSLVLLGHAEEEKSGNQMK